MIKGFKMKLYPGMEAEYEKRHNQLWPEMKDMIHEHGGKNYTIFLDRETLTLFGYIEIENEELWAKGADTAINQQTVSKPAASAARSSPPMPENRLTWVSLFMADLLPQGSAPPGTA